MRTTSSPASIMRARVLASLEAGPRVATIFVRRVMGGKSTSRRLGGALLQDLDRGQLAPLEEFQKRAAAGGNIGNPVGDAELGNGRERVAAARDGERLRFRDGERDGLRAAG